MLMLVFRYSHTSTVLGKQLLLTGGFFSPNTTELLPVDRDDASVEGFPFNPTLWDHCAIQVDWLFAYKCITHIFDTTLF